MKIDDVKILARKLMNENGLEDWKFKFDSAKRRLGCCYYNKKIISLSSILVKLNNEEQIRDTILHEIAHALLPPIEGHSRKWRLKAQAIGCCAKRCVESEDIITPLPNYRAICNNCGRIFSAFRKKRVDAACNYCCKKFNNNRYNPRFKLKFVKVKNES